MEFPALEGISTLGLSFSGTQLTNSHHEGESCTLKWGHCLKSFNCGLAGSDQRCTSPRSGQGEVAAGRRQQGSPSFRLSREECDLQRHLLKTTCYKAQIIHLILPLPTLFFCQLAFQEPLVQRAANYSRNSNGFLSWQRSNKGKPPAMRAGVGSLPQPPAQCWEGASHAPNSSLTGQKLPEHRWGAMQAQEDEDGTRLRGRKQQKESG